MEIVYLGVFIIAAGIAAILIWRQPKPGNNWPLGEPKIFDKPYTQFLKNMETVFRSNRTKDEKDLFIKQHSKDINQWSLIEDFAKKYAKVRKYY